MSINESSVLRTMAQDAACADSETGACPTLPLGVVRNVAQKQLQPLGPGHHVGVAFQPQVHLGAVDDRIVRKS